MTPAFDTTLGDLPGTGAWILLCALAVAALLVAEWRCSQRGKWFVKPLASAAFVATALAVGAPGSDYGWLVLAGLTLCFVGDVLLIPQGRDRVFRTGIFAFLFGHVAYAAAFLTRPLHPVWLVVAGVVLAGLLWRVWRWLDSGLPGHMRKPVLAYLVVIGTMSTLAVALTGAGGPWLVAAGALGFTASDVSVARDRFVHEEFRNRAWGLPLYYGAQLLLALSPAAVS
jgi:uncharacterized membrane protein YhhN